jgi:hypothetical protein
MFIHYNSPTLPLGVERVAVSVYKQSVRAKHALRPVEGLG